MVTADSVGNDPTYTGFQPVANPSQLRAVESSSRGLNPDLPGENRISRPLDDWRMSTPGGIRTPIAQGLSLPPLPIGLREYKPEPQGSRCVARLVPDSNRRSSARQAAALTSTPTRQVVGMQGVEPCSLAYQARVMHRYTTSQWRSRESNPARSVCKTNVSP